LHRPDVRNALSSELLGELRQAMVDAEQDPQVQVVVLTGTDPAFCAGLDLREVGAGGPNLQAGTAGSLPWPPLNKLLIGAINGVAVTGGLELALLCDMLVASDRAKFGDTHARVGIMPGWGMSVLLTRAIGLARAIEMSMTGNFMTADEALAFGLVNHVVPHDQLLPFTQQLAADAAGNDVVTARNLLASYRRIAGASGGAVGRALEAEASRAWLNRGFDVAEVERRRQAVVDRGRTQ
jgi:enoyl-CoA hydratase